MERSTVLRGVRLTEGTQKNNISVCVGCDKQKDHGKRVASLSSECEQIKVGMDFKNT